MWYQNFFAEMPKAELHLHLDGSLETKTVFDWVAGLSAARRRELGLDNLSWAELYARLGTETVLADQTELIGYFDLPGLVLQSADFLRRAAAELVEREANQKILYSEIRWAPALHVTPELPLAAVIEAVLEGAMETAKRRGVKTRLIACGMRHLPFAANLQMLEVAAPYQKQGLVGVDFAGVEAKNPDPLAQRRYFERAHELGFKVTVHGGELRQTAPTLAEALAVLKPDRVAHGAVLLDEPEALDWLRQNDVPLDLCPTSNIQAGLFEDYSDFPLAELLAAGIAVTLSTDDPVVSRVSLAEEYGRLYATGLYSLAELWQINLEGLRRAWLPEAEKASLLERYLAWAGAVPDLNEA